MFTPDFQGYYLRSLRCRYGSGCRSLLKDLFDSFVQDHLILTGFVVHHGNDPCGRNDAENDDTRYNCKRDHLILCYLIPVCYSYEFHIFDPMSSYYNMPYPLIANLRQFTEPFMGSTVTVLPSSIRAEAPLQERIVGISRAIATVAVWEEGSSSSVIITLACLIRSIIALLV